MCGISNLGNQLSGSFSFFSFFCMKDIAQAAVRLVLNVMFDQINFVDLDREGVFWRTTEQFI